MVYVNLYEFDSYFYLKIMRKVVYLEYPHWKEAVWRPIHESMSSLLSRIAWNRHISESCMEGTIIFKISYEKDNFEIWINHFETLF